MNNTAPADDVSLPDLIEQLTQAYNASTPGAWGKGVSTHQTVSKCEGRLDYRIGEFRHADDAQFCDVAHRLAPSIIQALADRARSAGAVAAWTLVADGLPAPGKPVLLDIGKPAPIRAMWAAKYTIEADDDADPEWAEYDAATDDWYCPEGWYEWNEHEETHWAVSATPLRWMAIPVPAAVDVGAAQAETAQAAPAEVAHEQLKGQK